MYSLKNNFMMARILRNPGERYLDKEGIDREPGDSLTTWVYSGAGESFMTAGILRQPGESFMTVLETCL